MNTAILAAIGTMFAFGISNPMQKPAIERLGVLRQIIYRAIFLSLITLVIAILNSGFINLDLSDVIWASVVSIASYFAFYLFCLALESGSASVVIPVTSSRVVFITIFSFLIFQEVISFWQYFFIVVVFMGIVLISGDITDLKKSLLSKQSILPLIAALIWGVCFPFFGYYSEKIGVYAFTFILEFSVLVLGILQWKFANKKDDRQLFRKDYIKDTFWLMLIISILVG